MAEDSFIGEIKPPDWLAKHGGIGVTDPGGFGLINFFSNALKILSLVAGIAAVLNFVLAGWSYLTSSGEKDKVEAAFNKIIYSIIGLLVIAISYVLAAVIGWLLFGDPTMIINPQISGVGE